MMDFLGSAPHTVGQLWQSRSHVLVLSACSGGSGTSGSSVLPQHEGGQLATRAGSVLPY